MSVTAALPDIVPAAPHDEPRAARRDEPPETERLPHGARRQRDVYDEATAETPPPQPAQRWARTEPPPYVHEPHIYEPNTGPLPEGFAMAAQQAHPEPPHIVDLEELSTFSSEVTLTIPLYRPDPDDPPPRWGGYDAVPEGQGAAYAEPVREQAAPMDPAWRWPPDDR
jgi:hypothetical protein